MGNIMCPGQDTAFWKPNDIFEVPCGSCGKEVEFFKDDATRRCKNCGTLVQNPKLSLGCALWCEHAKECLGYDPKEKLAQAKTGEVSMQDRLIEAMKNVFGKDQKRIDHTLKVLEYAQELMGKEGGNPLVVLAGAILHDIGIPKAEEKHDSSQPRFQEMEGPEIAERIMKDLALNSEVIDHVSRIIANHHSAKNIDTQEFRIVWDSDWLVNIPNDFKDLSPEKTQKLIEKVFKTPSGKNKAQELFL